MPPPPPWGTVLPDLPSTGSGPPAFSWFVQQAYQGKAGVPWTAVIPAHRTAIPKGEEHGSSTVGPPEAELSRFDPPRVAVRTWTDMVPLLVSPANAGALPAPPRLLAPWRHRSFIHSHGWNPPIGFWPCTSSWDSSRLQSLVFAHSLTPPSGSKWFY